MHPIVRRIVLFCAVAVTVVPISAHASIKVAQKPMPLEVSGWIPYWRTATGTADTLQHLDSLTEINPFGYTVRNDGTLYDAMNITQEPWSSLVSAAKAKKVRVIPTVMWSNADAIHAVLRKTSSRIALEDSIADLVKQNGFDGIDIDFENKKFETRDYFSLFLKGLYQRLGNKWLMCSIEPRMPLAARFDGTPPKDATQYVNNYAVINTYCDRVRLMTYDQGTADVQLNAAQSAPYVPIADPKWVEKVVTLASQIISKKKLVIGIATYGYEYQVTPLSTGFRYDLQWALNPKYALDLAASLGITPVRNSAGELSYLYMPTATSTPGNEPPVSNNEAVASTSFSKRLAAASLPLAAALPLNVVWWSDASAIQDKIALANKLGVRGISIFKFDGGEDPALWNLLPRRP